MSIKSEGRTIGRLIRKLTGLSLPIAQKLGRGIAQGKTTELESKFSNSFKIRREVCENKCCAYSIFTVIGPNNHVECEYYISVEKLSQEMKMRAFFLAEPNGTYNPAI